MINLEFDIMYTQLEYINPINFLMTKLKYQN